jgi:hypothetical protein
MFRCKILAHKMLIGYKLKYIKFFILHQLQYTSRSSDRISKLNCSLGKKEYVLNVSFFTNSKTKFVVQSKKNVAFPYAQKKKTCAIQKFLKFSAKKIVAERACHPAPNLHIKREGRCLSSLLVCCSHSGVERVVVLSCSCLPSTASLLCSLLCSSLLFSLVVACLV